MSIGNIDTREDFLATEIVMQLPDVEWDKYRGLDAKAFLAGYLVGLKRAEAIAHKILTEPAK